MSVTAELIKTAAQKALETRYVGRAIEQSISFSSFWWLRRTWVGRGRHAWD